MDPINPHPAALKRLPQTWLGSGIQGNNLIVFGMLEVDPDRRIPEIDAVNCIG